MMKNLKYIILILVLVPAIAYAGFFGNLRNLINNIGIVLGRTVCYPFQGCTGTSTAPSAGDLLIGNSSGTYDLTSSSPLPFATVGGSNTQLQYNNNGTLAGADLEYSSSTDNVDFNGHDIDNLGNVVFQNGATGGTIRTGTSNADKWLLQAYDVNGGAYVSVAEADAGNEPLFHLFDESLNITDTADTGKRIEFELSGITTGNTRTLTIQDGSGTLAYTSDITSDHGGLTGLSDDDHSIYALLAGRSGGQTLIGGTASGEDLTLQSTSNATKGKILFGTSAYDEVNNRLGIGTSTPSSALEVDGNITLSSAGGKTITTPGNELVLEQTGDTLGDIKVSLRNRSGSVGVIYENPDLDLIEFQMKGSGGNSATVRYESRTGQFKNSGASEEIQFGLIPINTAGNPWAAMSDVGTTFNPDGADRDFIVEGDTNPNLFFVDASTDRVGIGTSAPSSILEVNKGSATSTITIGGPGSPACFKARDTDDAGFSYATVLNGVITWSTTSCE